MKRPLSPLIWLGVPMALLIAFSLVMAILTDWRGAP